MKNLKFPIILRIINSQNNYNSENGDNNNSESDVHSDD